MNEHFEVFPSVMKGFFYWRWVSKNGQKTCSCNDPYKSRRNATRACKALNQKLIRPLPIIQERIFS